MSRPAAPEHRLDRGAHVLDPARRGEDDDDVGRVLHEGAEARLALTQHDAGLVRLVDEPGDAPGDAERGDAGDDGEHDRGARARVVEQHHRGHREQRRAEHDHAGAPVPDQPRVGPSQSARIDGCMTAAASRKYEIGHSASSIPPSV